MPADVNIFSYTLFFQQELKDLVKAKIQSYLKSEQLGIIQELQTKIDELQEANDKWKQKAKDLEKQMLDLTILQQKHEKRKAKTAALRVSIIILMLTKFIETFL